MEANYREFVRRLHENEVFQQYAKDVLLPRTPPIKRWTPDAKEIQWVYDSGMRDGYLLALSNLGFKDAGK